MNTITTTERRIYVGRCILMGLDDAGKSLFGIASKPANPGTWARSGNRKQDLARVQREYAKHQCEGIAQTAK